VKKWKYFTEDEVKCKHTGLCHMDDDFMTKLDIIREEVGVPFIVTSGYRDKTHPIEAKKTTPGAHASGKAVDILIRGKDALKLIEVALKHGITGLGVKQQGDSRFIHLDTLDSEPHRPRPTVWSYK
jgi:zinc D-Ala-D-Ala carboxypeptidase